MRRGRLLAPAAAALAVAAAFAVRASIGGDSVPTRTLPTPRRPVLPDLALARLSDITPANADDGAREILFTASIVNVGRGPFLVHAARHHGASHWLVTQRFVEARGGTSERTTPADLVWGGHGHDHWHVRLGASYELFRLVKGSPARLPVRVLRKAGFCFFDQRPFAALRGSEPRAPRITRTACNGRETTSLTMGLSPGWADPYSWLLPDQRLDVTQVPAGLYRLQAVADPDHWFRESNERDNRTWVDLRLWTTAAGSLRLRVLRYGPSAGALRPL